ncbi:MAG: EAL domain-containing protein [Bacilli bacterium]|nr:EAL domain-containing protein [Bacilli bacterium]
MAHKRLRIRENTSYTILFFALFGYFIFELISTALDSEPRPEAALYYLTWIANIAYFFFLGLQSYFFYLFFASHLHLNKSKWRVFFYCLSSLPLLSAYVILALSPALHTVFWISEEGIYHGGHIYKLFIILCGVYPLLALLTILLFRKRVPIRIRLNLIISSSLLVIGYVFRFAMPGTVILPTFTVLSIIVAYIGVGNPRYYMNEKTGLFSQKGMVLMLDEAIREKRKAPVLLLVITQYQKSRDLYRDKEMDRWLKKIAKFLNSQPLDVAVSYNHEGRFMILTKSEEDAKEMELLIFDKLLNAEDSEIASGLNLNLSIIECLDSDAYESGADYSRSVERAVSLAEAGKVIPIDDEVRAKQKRESYVQKCLAKAIREQNVTVLFQPLKDLKTGAFYGGEALSRIEGEDGEIIPPSEFIYLAEQNGSIRELSDIVYGKVLDFLAEHPEKYSPIKSISVNLSPIQCLDPNLANNFIALAKSKGVDLSRINFEITESAFINLDSLRKQMEQLIEAGSSFSLDDFGTGYSDLARVTALPFKAIKFDISLVRSYSSGQNTFLPYLSKAVKYIKRMIVAEGIEDQEVEKKVSDLGIDFGQGFLYSKPLTADDFVLFVKEHSK